MTDASAPRDNEDYWIARHRKLQGSLAAVGNIGSTEPDNTQRYARKKRRTVSLLRDLGTPDLTGMEVLDAGCGIGEVSELLYALGARVSGVDASPEAIAQAQNRAPAEGMFMAGSLLDFRFPTKFKIIFCLDVLYHVVDDENWRGVLRNFEAHLAPNGRIVLYDQIKPEAVAPAAHVRFRTRAMYDEALPGFRHCTPPGHDYALVYERVTG